jgi:hypothetical protein
MVSVKLTHYLIFCPYFAKSPALRVHARNLPVRSIARFKNPAPTAVPELLYPEATSVERHFPLWGPHGQVLVRGVEVNATFSDFPKDTRILEPLNAFQNPARSHTKKAGSYAGLQILYERCLCRCAHRSLRRGRLQLRPCRQHW